jgi:hypothetical protein
VKLPTIVRPARERRDLTCVASMFSSCRPLSFSCCLQSWEALQFVKFLRLHSSSLDGVHRRFEALGAIVSSNLDRTQKGFEVLGTMLSSNLGTIQNGFEALGTTLSSNVERSHKGFEALGTMLDLLRRRLETVQGELGRLSNRAQVLETTTGHLKCRADAEAQQIERLREGIAISNFALATIARFDWHLAIAGAMKERPLPHRAQKFLCRRKTGSQPVDLVCSDGNRYVVKALRSDDPKSTHVI